MKSNLEKANIVLTALLVAALVALAVMAGKLHGPAAGAPSAAPGVVAAMPPVSIYFSPRGGCTAAVVDELDRAKSSIRVQAYSFTSAPIAKALVDAKRRGLDVAIILDKSQRTEKYSSADFVAHADIPTFIDAAHAIAHNKVMVIDDETVLTGSFNFTKAAEDRNAENLLVIHDAAIAVEYLKNWDAHRAHSEVYEGR